MIMTVPVNVDVSDSARGILSALAQGDPDLLAAGLEVRAEWEARSGLDARSYALVKIAALIALPPPPPPLSLGGAPPAPRARAPPPGAPLGLPPPPPPGGGGPEAGRGRARA